MLPERVPGDIYCTFPPASPWSALRRQGRIDWATVGEAPDLTGTVLANARNRVAMRADGDDWVYVTGEVRLDAADVTSYLRQRDGQSQAQSIVEHELGHLVGLDHVNDPTQLMYPMIQPGVTDYSDGDLTGLALLGSGQCAPDV